LGIRVAVGSTPRQLFGLVVSQGIRVIGLGLVVGILGSLALVRLIQSLLYGVQPTDPLVLTTVAAMLAAVGVAACLLPARRATRIDPVVALSDE
jgi:ABC-type antimicrobial peptide transport system permease subunit